MKPGTFAFTPASEEAPSHAGARPERQGYWGLVAAGEPFRLLFPLGTVIGIFGVLLWPLFVWNVTAVYPGQIHARIMIEGFLTSFVVGFLGTALPRLLGVPRLTVFETLGFAVALAGTVWLHFRGKTLWGDVAFLVLLGALVAALGVRFMARKDIPPPGFVLVALGIFCALAGAATQILAQVALSALPGWVISTGRLMLFQGYLLLPIMGIGAFLLPRFFGLPNRHSFPESLAFPPGWKPRAAFALACGAAVVTSFVLEARGEVRWGTGLRAAAVAAYFAREVPFHRTRWGGSSLALGLRIALFSIPAGYALMAVWPEKAFSFLHVVLISGFSLLTFIVASRVVLGHSGQSDKLAAPLRSIFILSGLIVVAMLTRVGADWMPETRMGHYAYAAMAWVAGVTVWAMAILPGVRKADSEE